MSQTPNPGALVQPNVPVHTPERHERYQRTPRSAQYLLRVLEGTPETLDSNNEFLPEQIATDRFGRAYDLLEMASRKTREEYWQEGGNGSKTKEQKAEEFNNWWTDKLVKDFSADGGEKPGASLLKNLGLDPDAMSSGVFDNFINKCTVDSKPSVKGFVEMFMQYDNRDELVNNLHVVELLAGMFDAETAKDIVGLIKIELNVDGDVLSQANKDKKVSNRDEIERLRFLSQFINAENDELSYPETPKVEGEDRLKELASGGEYNIGHASAKGAREIQQDAILSDQMEGGTLVGVLDGNGRNGQDVVKVMKDEGPAIYARLLKEGLTKQNAFEKLCQQLSIKTDEIDGGAVAVIAHLDEQAKIISIASVGDAQVALLSPDSIDILSGHTHRLESLEEQRLLSRVPQSDDEGRHITRGIGLNVSSKPNYMEVPLIGSDKGPKYLLLSCDGFWEAVSPSEVYQKINEFKQANANISLAEISEKLVQFAIRERGSSDNVSVVLVDLNMKKGSKEV
ncbi:protein serine/threonine phosphatase 2C family protein [Candidatus Dojkabacteria bacterium]|jgi:serine/threonine protein phosphatase PrpC|uniref:Protein serine/threonine phosphatase 2C family protein n=1 Tax=Candidatus Dojkabacteria bacterium TaxID=2099670 RepID=A0A955L0P4_9BACT|nr:protein serine/threonine phosphatase 2C family protein [Candidatus Dojkabacteria bacterium]